MGHNPNLGAPSNDQDRSVLIGSDGNWQGCDESVVIGFDTRARGPKSIIIGHLAGDNAAANATRHAVMIGNGWFNYTDTGNTFGGLVIGHAKDAGSDEGLPGLARIVWPRAFGDKLEMGDENSSYANNGTEVTLATPLISFEGATPFPGSAKSFTFTLPTLGRMFVESIEVVVETGDGTTGVTTDMVLDVGSTGVDSTDILAAQTFNTAAVPVTDTRETYVSLIPDTAFNAITVTMDTAGAWTGGGGVPRGWFVIRGVIFNGVA